MGTQAVVSVVWKAFLPRGRLLANFDVIGVDPGVRVGSERTYALAFTRGAVKSISASHLVG
ncbi:hypothetical protein GCM10009646_67900 [Streptomyces aureus]